MSVFPLGGAARADSVNVDISSLVNANAQTALNGGSFPGGGTTLTNDGVSVLLAGAHPAAGGMIQTQESNSPRTIDISVNIVDPATVYTLIDSAYGEFGFTAGTVVSGNRRGLTNTVNLVEGQNIRDYNNDDWNNTIETAPGFNYVNAFSSRRRPGSI